MRRWGVAGFHTETSETNSSPALGKAGSINNGKLDQGQGSTGTSPQCPQCGSARVWKDGIRETAFGPVQRYLCRNCAYRFSDPDSKQTQRFFNGSSVSQHVETIDTKKLKSKTAILNYCRVSNDLRRRASTGQQRLVQNLAEVETRKQEKAAGATETTSADAKGRILEFAWHMKKTGKSDATIETRIGVLQLLAQQVADLFNPESVKETIAFYQCSDASKRVMVDAYNSFAKFLGIPWEPPKYKTSQKFPFIPLEREIDDLIACCSKKTGALLQMLKETGARLGEALELKWTDIDFERKVVRIEPEKGSNPRIFKISDKLLGMINGLPKNSQRIFGGKVKKKVFIESLRKARKKSAAKLQNPRLLQIHYHTLRHWVGTMEYHKTKDPWHVKRVLGHKSLQSTEIYINIEQALFEEAPEEFHVKVAEKPEEIKALLEVGFEYVCEKGGLMYFRKRK